MRSTCSVYVDAGYLLSSLASLTAGTSLRNSIHVEYATLMQRIKAQAEAICGLPVLRINWYDAAKNGVPDVQQQRIGELASVKVRLGRFGVDGTQKGVDLRMGLDMVAHARNGAGDVFFLVSGDDDLTEAVEEAQVHGAQLMIMAIPNQKGSANSVSHHLLRAADELHTLSPELFKDIVTKVIKPEPSIEEVAPAETDILVTKLPQHPKPSDMPRTRPIQPPPSSTIVWTSSGATSSRVQVMSQQIEVTDEQIDQVVLNVLSAFKRSAPMQEQELLLLGKPSIPREIDRALLLDMCNLSGLDDLDDQIRMRLRARFWQHADIN